MKTLICKHCSKPFQTYVATRTYCSHPCYASAKQSKPIELRFWKRVSKAGTDDCWLWTGATHQYGYGRMGTGKRGEWKATEAHRVSWEIHFGPIPDGMHVCHSCDNPPCVNPAHLFLGTNNDNRQDSVKKNRHTGNGKSGHPQLTAELAKQIRNDYASGDHSYRTLAKKYTVSLSAIKAVIRRHTYKSI